MTDGFCSHAALCLRRDRVTSLALRSRAEAPGRGGHGARARRWFREGAGSKAPWGGGVPSSLQAAQGTGHREGRGGIPVSSDLTPFPPRAWRSDVRGASRPDPRGVSGAQSRTARTPGVTSLLQGDKRAMRFPSSFEAPAAPASTPHGLQRRRGVSSEARVTQGLLSGFRLWWCWGLVAGTAERHWCPHRPRSDPRPSTCRPWNAGRLPSAAPATAGASLRPTAPRSLGLDTFQSGHTQVLFFSFSFSFLSFSFPSLF